MTQIASLFAAIGADTSGLDAGLAKSKESLSSFAGGFAQLQSAVTAALAVVGTAIAGAGAAVIGTGIQFDALKESANTAFTTMLGSGTAAQKMLNDLQAFAQRTPFEFPDLIRASQRLMAMGFQAQQVIPQLTAIGDAVAAMGGSAEMVDRVTLAIGQMNAKGKASGEEMRQLTEAGIPVWQMLADKIGVTVPEAMKQVTAGAVSASVAISAINEGIESRFGGMMDKQSQTWNGLISNIKDGFTQLSGAIMQPFFDFAKEKLAGVVDALGILQRAFQSGKFTVDTFKAAMEAVLPQEIVDNMVTLWNTLQNIIVVVRAAVAPIVDLVAKFISWRDVLTAFGIVIASVLGSIVVTFAPVIATFAALVAAVAALRYAWQTDFGNIRSITLDTLSKIRDWISQHTGIYLDSWQTFADKLNYLVFFMWSNYVYFPIRSFLIKTRDDVTVYLTKYIPLIFNNWVSATKETVSGWVSDVMDKLNTWKRNVIDTYNEWKDKIVGTITTWVDETKRHVQRWVDYWTGDIGVLATWKRKVLEYFQPVIDFWKDKVQPWINYGRDLIQGLWDGIKEKWNNLSSWFQGVWGDLTNRFKSFFGIHSPSTVFADYGQAMMEGLAYGLSSNQKLVVDAMGNISTAMIQADPWASLKDTLGLAAANNFVEQMYAMSANARQALMRAGIDTGNPAYQTVDEALKASTSDTVTNIKNDIDNVVSQLNALGLNGNTTDSATVSGLNQLSSSLGDLLAGDVYSNPTPATPTSLANGVSDGSSTDPAVAILSNILKEIQKDNKSTQAILSNILTALSSRSGYGVTVAATSMLRSGA